jgi:hypothetical protein
MKIQAVRCYNCNTIIFSRCESDIQACRCFDLDRNKRRKWISVRGGVDDPRVTGESGALFERVEISVEDVSRSDLYRDWNLNINMYGKISEEENHEENSANS